MCIRDRYISYLIHLTQHINFENVNMECLVINKMKILVYQIQVAPCSTKNSIISAVFAAIAILRGFSFKLRERYKNKDKYE